MMKTSTNRTRHDIQRKVSGFHSVHSVILMNPSEVNELTWGYAKDYRKELRGTWIAHGIVSQEMFAALKRNTSSGVVHDLTISTTLGGAKYAVISTQLGSWQHRFLMPLYESKAIELFTGASTKPLSFFLPATEVTLEACSSRTYLLGMFTSKLRPSSVYQTMKRVRNLPWICHW